MTAPARIPSPAELPELVLHLRRYLDAAKRHTDNLAERVKLNYNSAIPLLDAEKDLVALFKSSGATSPFGWTDPVNDALIYIYQYIGMRHYGDVTPLEQMIKTLAEAVEEDAGNSDESGYITFAEACKVTGLKPYELTRLCNKPGGKIRSLGKGKGRRVHAIDLIRQRAGED
jgi:hypothetical protein